MEVKPDTWHSRSSKHIADCQVFTVCEQLSVRDRDGSEAAFFTIESPDWVNIIALTPSHEVVMIDQFRHGIERTITEIPGGIVDKGEDPLDAAKRELREETGYTSDRWTLLGRSHPNPALQNNEISHFMALDCDRSDRTDLDDHESIVANLVPLDEFRRMIAAGKVTHSLVVAAFYYLSLNQ